MISGNTYDQLLSYGKQLFRHRKLNFHEIDLVHDVLAQNEYEPDFKKIKEAFFTELDYQRRFVRYCENGEKKSASPVWKFCKLCKTEKPEQCFKLINYKSGLQFHSSYCIDCEKTNLAFLEKQAAYHKVWKKKNAVSYGKYQKKYRLINKERRREKYKLRTKKQIDTDKKRERMRYLKKKQSFKINK